jgi:hypothetical protein
MSALAKALFLLQRRVFEISVVLWRLIGQAVLFVGPSA